MTVPLLFPTLAGIGFPIGRSANWDTEVQESTSGKRTTNGYYIKPIYQYEVPFNVLRTGLWLVQQYKEIEDLQAFFNAVGGRRDLFQWNDVDRNTATEQFFGTGDGTATEFQLLTQTAGNTFTFYDPVYYPTITNIKDNGTILTPVTDYTVNSTGMVTFVVPPVTGHTLTWNGTFTWLCRFDEDSASFEKFMQNLYRLQKIKFSTEKI